MPSDLPSYLASRYLVADSKPKSKKRKRKATTGTNGLVITDEADDSWGQTTSERDPDKVDGPATVSGTSAEFRRAKKSNWKILDGSQAKPTEDDRAADAILASTAAENAAAQAEDDEVPIVEESSLVRMSDGTHAGLQSAATVSAQLKRRQRDERDDFERHRKGNKEEETVYRDATGRRIDVSMRRAEARKAAVEMEEKGRQAEEALKGDVQLAAARKRREELDDAKLLSFARTADDEELNKDLKDKERWNDPMMQFMADKKTENSRGKGKRNRPIYVGAAPPNRYGIKPGYRWDGVDRGNGFESERFKAINRRKRNQGLDYSWQMDE